MTRTKAMKKPTRSRFPAMVSGILFFSACLLIPSRAFSGAIKIGEAEEIRMGEKISESLCKNYGVVNNPEWDARLQRLFAPLRSVAKRTNLVFKIQVLDMADVNALAVPGGFIFVTRGLMEFVKSDRELQAVLAHELIHIDRRHGITTYRKSMENLLYSMLIVMGSRDTNLIPALALVNEGLLQGYGRQAELEADGFGVEYMIQCGADPLGMLAFMDRMAREEMKRPNLFDGYFTVHPPTKDRIQAIEQILKKYNIPYDHSFSPEIPLDVQSRSACKGDTQLGIVVVEDDPVFTFAGTDHDPKAGIKKAREIQERLTEYSKTGLQAYEVQTLLSSDRWLITVRGEALLQVTDQDAAAAGITPEALARKWRDDLAEILWRAFILERV